MCVENYDLPSHGLCQYQQEIRWLTETFRAFEIEVDKTQRVKAAVAKVKVVLGG